MTGAEFNDARASLKATRSAMAKALEVDRRTLYRWEYGEWPVPRVVAIVVRAALRHAWVRLELGINAKTPHPKGPPAAPR